MAASAAARCIVVMATRTEDPVYSDRMYVCGYSENQYREVKWPAGCNCWDTPLLSQTTPELFVIGQFWRDVHAVPTPSLPPPPKRGGDLVGLYRVALPSGETELLHVGRSKGSHVDEAGWVISKLLGLTPDGSRLLVSLSMGYREGGTTKWRYHVAVFDPSTGEFDLCAQLPAVFA